MKIQVHWIHTKILKGFNLNETQGLTIQRNYSTLQSWVQTLGATLPIRLAYPGLWWRENIVFATVPKLLNTIRMYV